jgi:hypothetical protein
MTGKPTHTSRHNDDDDENDQTNDYAHAHLHILPPHLFSHSIRAPSEALGGDCKVIGLVLERVQAFAALRDLVDILAHYTNGIVNLLETRRISQSAIQG